jgi:hypothetical protein
MWGSLSDERTGLSFPNVAGPRQRSHFWDSRGIRDRILLRFETSFFVASYDSQGHGVGIRLSLYTGLTKI